MDNQLKETLLKVADYNELERQKAAEAGNRSFGLMFLVCAAVIIVQILMRGNLSLVIGETVVLIAGGLVYLYFMVKNGAWNGTPIKSTAKNDFAVSIICAGVFSIIFCFVSKGKTDLIRVMGMTACFFGVVSAVSYALLRGISRFSGKKEAKLKQK